MLSFDLSVHPEHVDNIINKDSVISVVIASW